MAAEDQVTLIEAGDSHKVKPRLLALSGPALPRTLHGSLWTIGQSPNLPSGPPAPEGKARRHEGGHESW